MQGLRLRDKVTLITGGGGGIGAATARIFCDEGAAVVLVDANAQALAKVCDDLLSRNSEARVQTYVADVASADQATAAVELATRTFGGLDVLVNNAAMRNYSKLADATPEEWQSMVSVNLVGTSNYCKAALPRLRVAGAGAGAGSIVNVSSCYAVTGRKGMGLYDATKAVMLALTRTP